MMIIRILSTKKNVILAIASFIFLVTLGLLFILRQRLNNIGVKNSKFVIACENTLISNDSTYKVCKIEKGEITPLESNQLSTNVHPRDRIVFSVNMKKLIAANTAINSLATPTLKVSSGRNISLCYTLYPVLMGNFLEDNARRQHVFTEQEVSSLYNQYIQEFKWNDFLKGMSLEASKNVNFICTKPFPAAQTQNISFVMELPSVDLLNATEKNGVINSDLRKYGVKIFLANDKLMSSSYSRDDILTNYNNLVTLAIFTNNISY